ncbi:hypothetical protein [Xylanibacter oryzae]|uniref:hypothetical protein n=1 Tax=Xylanibacter oryzae TaxID=185293 RepID=UPI0004B565D5|nr:hypothetical protein [Xylanibacter oryzae]
MPTKKNYNDLKEEILKESHNGKSPEEISEIYKIPQIVVERWIEQEEQNIDVFSTEAKFVQPPKLKKSQTGKIKEFFKQIINKHCMVCVIIIALICITSLTCSFRKKIISNNSQKQDLVTNNKVESLITINKMIEKDLEENNKQIVELNAIIKNAIKQRTKDSLIIIYKNHKINRSIIRKIALGGTRKYIQQSYSKVTKDSIK